MFDSDILIKGKHATYLKFLKESAGVFNRHMDVYLLAPIIGMSYGKMSDEDSTSSDTVRMFADVVIREQQKLQFIYRLIILLDETAGKSIDDRIDLAFRYDSNSEITYSNLKVFNKYVLGGIEFLYEKFHENCTTKQDYIDMIHKFVTDFKNDIEPTKYDELIEEIIS